MRLTTRNGRLDLAKGFTLAMERTNPLLSGDGDTTVPATLPASSGNLAAIGHLERIDRAERYMNKVEAILEVGPVQKRGQLVIDTAHRHDGIEASFAIDNSDLYVSSKNKSLKDIIDMGRGGQGIKIPFTDVDNACQYMISIYNGNMPQADFVVFPVAVSAYEAGEGDDKHTIYQYNNQPGGPHGLVYEERTVREGNVEMLVPKGYGIAPFLKLQRLISVLFQCLGYTMVSNCFDEGPFLSQIAIVHNCSDCLVRPELDYKDLVPSCTLSEFLEWLLAKFHVQPVVNSESKEVRVVKMDELLNANVGGYDMDITGMVEGDWKVQLNPSKRVVLTPTIEIEGTEPAAETFDKLMEKYGSFVECNESQFWTLDSNTPAFYDCLIFRKATGEFYYLERNPNTGKVSPSRLGTNYFTYDRNNSDDTEGFNQSDVMPLMLCGPKRETAPYIGDRTHRHTAYNGKTDDSVQKIIAVQARTSQNFAYRTTGTTQNCIPNASGDTYYYFWFGMDNYSMYPEFWANYNRLLLNHPVRLTCRLNLGIAQFLGMDMINLKLCDGQRLLPVKASAAIGDRMGVTEAEFIRAEHYLDGVKDDPITPSPGNGLRWEMSNNADAVAQILWQQIVGSFVPSQNIGVEFDDIYFNGYDVSYDIESLQPGTPQTQGETKEIGILATFVIHVHEVIEYATSQEGHQTSPVTEEHDWDETFHNQTVIFTFVAVPA